MLTVFEWIGSLALLGILFLIVPAVFMLLITLQFRLFERMPAPMPNRPSTERNIANEQQRATEP